jgi:hypothetical protein
MIKLSVALIAAASTVLPNQTAAAMVVLRVRAYADHHLDKTKVRPVLEFAEHLLASAGLTMAWRFCDTAESCPFEDKPVREIVVILSSRDRQNGRDNCGVAARGTDNSPGTVIVSVPCVSGAAFRLSRRTGTRTNPLLAMPRHDDIVGAIVAHEIGHLLGARHAPAGLMRALLKADDIIALRQGKLRFDPAEASKMRIQASSAAEDRMRASAVGLARNPPRQ